MLTDSLRIFFQELLDADYAICIDEKNLRLFLVFESQGIFKHLEIILISFLNCQIISHQNLFPRSVVELVMVPKYTCFRISYKNYSK